MRKSEHAALKRKELVNVVLQKGKENVKSQKMQGLEDSGGGREYGRMP